MHPRAGTPLPIYVNAAPIYANGGTVVGIVGVTEDISQRKQSEAALRRNEVRFHTTFEQAAVGIAHISPGGAHILVNNRLCTILGFHRFELLQKNWRDIIHPDDQVASQAQVQQLLQGKIESFALELRLLGKAGNPVWVNATVSLVRTEQTDQPDYLISVIEDISVRKSTTLALARAERQQADLLALLQSMLDHAPLGFAFFNRDHRYVRINPTLAALNGFPPSAHLGKTPDELMPGLAAMVDPLIEQVFVTGQPIYNLEVSRRLPPATDLRYWLISYYPVMDGPTLRFVGCMVVEISEQKRAAEALRTSNERFRIALQNAPLVVYTVDLDLRYTWMHNPQLGFSSEQIIGKRDDELLPPDSAAPLIKFKQEVLADGVSLRREFNFWHAGRHYDYDLTAEPLRDEQNQIIGLTVAALDITDLRQHEANLQALNESLEQRIAQRTAELTHRNAELDAFAYVASHDLKAPLRAIDHLAAWISDDAGALLPPPSGAHLVKLRGRVKRMEKLLDDLLAYSRIGRLEGALETVDIGALIADIIHLLGPPDGFRIHVQQPMPHLTTQRTGLELVLRNLISNALKHHNHPAGQISVTAQDLGNAIEFAVTDDGPGIEETFHARIFQMFQTLHPRDQVEGSGMGLAIVKKVVESRGGRVQVQSAAGRGATFRFTWMKEGTTTAPRSYPT